jgi:hypothetical protein
MPLRQGAVAPFDCRGGPLQALGLLSRPRVPLLTHMGRQLHGAGVQRTRVVYALQRLEPLGLPSRATWARSVRLPLHQRQQHVFHPWRPLRGQGHVRSIVPNPLPPHVHQGGHAPEWRADRVQGLLCDGHPVRVEERCTRVDLGVSRAFTCFGPLARRVKNAPRRSRQRPALQGVSRGAGHGCPVRHRSVTRRPHGLRWLGLSTAALLLRLLQSLTRVSQTTATGERRALHQRMDAGQHLRPTPALQARCGQLDQRLCAVTHQGEPLDAPNRSPRLAQRVPGVLAPVLCHRLAPQGAADEIHAHQPHALSEGVVSRPHEGAPRSLGSPLVLPALGGLQDRLLQRLPHPSQGAG